MSSTPQKNDPETSKGMYAGSWTYVWLALGFAVIGLLFVAWNYYVIASSTTALGTVVSVESIIPSGDKPLSDPDMYKPLFSFTDENGDTHERTVRFSDADYGFEIGRELEIAYSLDNLTYVSIVDWSESLFFPKFCFTLAGLCLLGFYWIRKNAAKLEAEGR